MDICFSNNEVNTQISNKLYFHVLNTLLKNYTHQNMLGFRGDDVLTNKTYKVKSIWLLLSAQQVSLSSNQTDQNTLALVN